MSEQIRLSANNGWLNGVAIQVYVRPVTAHTAHHTPDVRHTGAHSAPRKDGCVPGIDWRTHGLLLTVPPPKPNCTTERGFYFPGGRDVGTAAQLERGARGAVQTVAFKAQARGSLGHFSQCIVLPCLRARSKTSIKYTLIVRRWSNFKKHKGSNFHIILSALVTKLVCIYLSVRKCTGRCKIL